MASPLLGKKIDVKNRFVQFDARLWHCIYPVKKEVQYSAVYYALNHLERLSGEDWTTLHECGFNPKLHPRKLLRRSKLHM
eukprot:3858485-Amphidinium_carterae.1